MASRGAAGTLSWTVRTAADPLGLAPEVRALVTRLDPEITIADLEPFSRVIARAHAPLRFSLGLIGLFSGLGLLLALVGRFE